MSTCLSLGVCEDCHWDTHARSRRHTQAHTSAHSYIGIDCASHTHSLGVGLRHTHSLTQTHTKPQAYTHYLTHSLTHSDTHTHRHPHSLSLTCNKDSEPKPGGIVPASWLRLAMSSRCSFDMDDMRGGMVPAICCVSSTKSWKKIKMSESE